MKIFKTTLLLAAVCCLGFTSCDKDDDKETPFTGTVAFDDFTSSFQSALYATLEAGGQSGMVAYLSPDKDSAQFEEPANGSAVVSIGNLAQNTVYDLTKYDEEAGVVIDFYTTKDGKEYEFSLSPDSDADKKYYILSRRIDGLHTSADDDFKVTAGTFKYSVKGSKLTFELNVTSEKSHSMTLKGSGAAKKLAMPNLVD